MAVTTIVLHAGPTIPQEAYVCTPARLADPSAWDQASAAARGRAEQFSVERIAGEYLAQFAALAGSTAPGKPPIPASGVNSPPHT